MMVAMFNNKNIQSQMVANKSDTPEKTGLLSFKTDGRLYRESVSLEKSLNNTFIFNIGISSDDCNLNSKLYKGVGVFLVTFLTYLRH